MSTAGPNFEIWKEPRGFLKCLEVFLSIFAFSCITGYRGSFSFHQTMKIKSASRLAEASFQYPFVGPMTVELMSNGSTADMSEVSLELSERHSTEFFVVIGVFCFLFSLGMLIYYVYFEDVNAKVQAKNNGTINWTSGPIVDFCVSVFFAFFWFVGSIACAAAVNGIKDSTNVGELIKKLELCKAPYGCDIFKAAKYATLTVAILLGFLNTFVWCGNTWFLWKETPWHKEPQPVPVPAQQHQQMPPAAI